MRNWQWGIVFIGLTFHSNGIHNWCNVLTKFCEQAISGRSTMTKHATIMRYMSVNVHVCAILGSRKVPTTVITGS